MPIETVGSPGSAHRETPAKALTMALWKTISWGDPLVPKKARIINKWSMISALLWSLNKGKVVGEGEGEALGVVCDLCLAWQIWGFSSDPGVGCRCSRWTGKLQVRSSRVWMSSRRAVRASGYQCQSHHNRPGFDPSVLRHNGIWGAPDEAVLNKVHEKKI